MAAAFDSRVARWTDFRAAICSRSRTQFNHYLEQRGFGGRLHFDHDKTELHLRVSTNETATKKAVQLSGGEKSFSTICLLLTIWESIGCSIRCLDEYVRRESFSFEFARQCADQDVQLLQDVYMVSLSLIGFSRFVTDAKFILL
jgi:hypothetical protein